MSVNVSRAKFKKATCSKDYRRILLLELYPPYYEEGWTWRHGNMENHKWREFRTWKHNRKKQWKS